MPVFRKAWSVSTKSNTATTQQEAPVHLFNIYTSVEKIYVSPRYKSVLINIKALAHAYAWESMVSVN